MKRVLVIGGYAPSLINFRGKLLELFGEEGCQVFTCAGETTDKVISQLSDLNVTHIPIELSRTGTSIFSDLKYFWCLLMIIRKVKPDFVLSYTIKPVIYGGFVALLLRVPFFALITGLGHVFMPAKNLKHSLVTKLSKFLYRISLSRAKHVFFQNSDDVQLFSDSGILDKKTPVKIVNGSGVDLLHFGQRKLPVKNIFLLIARLLKDKGIGEYVEAAKLVKQKYPSARFQLLGPFDSNPAAFSESQIHKWQEEGIIEYLGSTNDVRKYIENCRFYVLPSYREGTPRTVLEAMSIGRPIITTNVPGCRQTVSDKANGLLVESHSIDELAKAMEWMITHSPEVEQMGKHSRQRAEELYDVHKVNNEILTTIKSSLK